MSQPSESHWKAVKCILGYLKGTISWGLLLRLVFSTSPVSLHAYCDVDWASDPDDRKSTSGACAYFGPNMVS